MYSYKFLFIIIRRQFPELTAKFGNLPLPRNGRKSFKNLSICIVIWKVIKIQLSVTNHTSHLSEEFHQNSSTIITVRDILLTNRYTNAQTE